MGKGIKIAVDDSHEGPDGPVSPIPFLTSPDANGAQHRFTDAETSPQPSPHSPTPLLGVKQISSGVPRIRRLSKDTSGTGSSTPEANGGAVIPQRGGRLSILNARGGRRASLRVVLGGAKDLLNQAATGIDVNLENLFITGAQQRPRLLGFRISYSPKFVQFLHFIIFITIVLLWLYLNGRNAEAYFQTSAVQTAFLSPSFTPRKAFWDMKLPMDWFNWMEFVFIPTLLPTAYYSNVTIPSARSRFIAGDVGVLVGQVRLRQLRVTHGDCVVAKRFNDTIGGCYPPYDIAFEEKDPWVKVNATSTQSVNGTYVRTNLTMSWEDNEKLGMPPYRAPLTLTVFPGTGYTLLLPNDQDEAVSLLHDLFNSTYIDAQTRMIFVEFLLFNPSNSLFTPVVIAAEHTPNGEITPSTHIRTLSLLAGARLRAREASTKESAAFILLLVVVAAVLVKFLSGVVVLVKVRKSRRSAFSWLNLMNCIMFMAQFLLSIAIEGWVINHGEEELGKLEGFPMAFQVINMWEWKESIMALNCCLTVMLLFQFVGFSKGLSLFNQTFMRSARDLINVSVMIAMLVVGYALCFMVAFGTTLPEFRTFNEAMASLFTLMLTSSIDFDAIRVAQPTLGPILFVSFIILLILFVLSMVFAVINRAFDEYQNEEFDVEQDALPLFHDSLRLGASIIKFAYRLPFIGKALPGTSKTAVTRFIMAAHGRVLLTEDELNQDIELDPNYKPELEVSERVTAAGNRWDDDGFAVEVPDNPRVDLLKRLIQMEDKQRETIMALEDLIMLSRKIVPVETNNVNL